MSRRFRMRRWVVAVALTALATAGCNGGEAPDGGPATNEPTGTEVATGDSGTYEASETIARSFDKSREVNLPEEGVVDAAMPTDHLLTLTGTTLQDRTFPDLAESWNAKAAAGQFVDLMVDGSDVYALAIRNVPGTGTKIGSNTYMVTKYDLESGSPQGAGAATLPQDASGASQAAIGQIVSAAGNVVLINSLTPPEGQGGAAGPPTAMAIKLGSPTPQPVTKAKPAWSRKGTAILWGDNQRAVLSMANPDKPGDVIVASAKNGRRQARLAEYTTSAAVVGSSGKTISLASTDGLFNLAQVGRYSLRTGRPAGGKPRTVATSSFTCLPASANAAVCSVGDGTLIGWNLAKNRQVWQLPTGRRFAPHVTTVKDGLLYGNLDDGTGVVLDARTGKDVTGSAGAGPIDVNEYGGVTLYLGIAVFTPQGTTPE